MENADLWKETEFLTLDTNTRFHEIFYAISNIENIREGVRKYILRRVCDLRGTGRVINGFRHSTAFEFVNTIEQLTRELLIPVSTLVTICFGTRSNRSDSARD